MPEATVASAGSPLPPSAAFVSSRLDSLDAYRGLVMLLLLGESLHFCQVSRALPDSGFWNFLCHHQSHVAWRGCSLHDLIQPSFSFLVGVALPFSLASRKARGQTFGKLAAHAVWRSIAMILLGVLLRSTGSRQTNWTFEDTLTQIGLGYLFLFFIGTRPIREQWAALVFLLVAYLAAFAIYPLPASTFDYTTVGVPADWPHLMSGFQAHWNKNSNLAWAFDTWYLNLFPREKPFHFNGGGYATLSFIPTLATMILGLIAGGVLRSERTVNQKLRWLAIAGLASLAGGQLLEWAGICPIVKRIWTPSWTLYSGGWCFLLLAGFFLVLDAWQQKRWAFPLLVLGMNSIAAYCIDQLFTGFISKNLVTHLGSGIFTVFGQAYEPFVHGLTTLAVSWCLLYWLYRKRIFLRI